ncbi:MAG: PKD domain-containing protein [Thermodesulfobacteriota bacterium]|nr:PKD domain-containing protein [Thermodesulfobacteriota bacterium]
MKTDFSAKTSSAKLTKKTSSSKFRFTMLPSLIFISIFVLPLLSISADMATSGVFPGTSLFNGVVNVTYNISGGSLGQHKDKLSYNDFDGNHDFIGRYYKGTFSPGVLRVQGTVTTTNDLESALLVVYVDVGLEPNEYRVNLDKGNQRNFDVSLPIPVEATYAMETFGANVEIFVNIHEYHSENNPHAYGSFYIIANLDWQDGQNFNQPPTVELNYEPAQPAVGKPINFTATASDPDGDILSYAWYMNGYQQDASSDTVIWDTPSAGTHTLKVVVSDGNGRTADDIVEFTVINEAKPYIIAPGYQEDEGEAWGYIDKVFVNEQEVTGVEQKLLYNGSQIKTGAGVEILVRSSYGAVVRVKENTQYEVKTRTTSSPTMQEIFGRLIKGVGEFYWPEGQAGARKFEVDTSRVVVGIKGTSLTVVHSGYTSIVTVQEGVVEVTHLDTGAVSQVHSGENLTVSYKPDGDVAPLGNRDSVVNVGDALVALRFALLLETPTQENIAHGDIAPLDTNGQPNPDGQITVGDALVILRMALGLITFVEF